MKKRVESGKLKLGMYVCEIDRQWPDSPFANQGFAIESADQLKLLSEHCRYVYIDTSVSPSETAPSDPPDKNIVKFSRLDRPELELEMLKKYAAPGQTRNGYPDRISVEIEIETVRETYKRAVMLIESVLSEVRHGKKLNAIAIVDLVSQLTDSIIRNPDALICFTKINTERDTTAQHGLRCAILALAFGRHLGMKQPQLHDLGIGALLHDIGKTRVPIEILECGYELNDEEKQSYRKHVADGIVILESTDNISSASVDVARHHHERFDGSGYALGLAKNEISQFGHIGNIVNRYDELTNDRPGQQRIPAHMALKLMYEKRDQVFHPHLIEEFIRCMGIYPIGSIVEMRSGEVGVVVALNRTRRLKPRVSIVLDPACEVVSNPVIVDLSIHRNQRGEVLEIANVLEEKAYNFDPRDYLPVSA